MSKWLKKESYEMFAEQKSNEAEKTDNTPSFFKKWKNPVMGTQEKAKEYIFRFLPDVTSGFYKKYFYHGFKSGDKFKYILCEKTYGMDNYCPLCDANKILYQGNEADKKKAKDYKRQERFVSNIFIVDDPRDAEMKDAAYKVNGTVRLYEFPTTVESKVKNEITDKKEGYGMSIFDPEHGYDMILKIKAKPKDPQGKEWPEYGDTIFSRKPSAIAETEEGIEKLMGERIDLDNYIASMKLSVEEMENLLKAEMLWDDVGRNFEKNIKGQKTATVSVNLDPTPAPKAKEEEAPVAEEKKAASVAKKKEEAPVVEEAPDDTDDLLAELQDM